MTEEQVALFINSNSLQTAAPEQVAAVCKNAGLSPGETIHVLVRAKGVTFGEAKKLMHFSVAWQAERANWDRFHQAIEDELKSKPTIERDPAK